MKRIIVVLSSSAALMAFMALTPPAHARTSTKHARLQACADKSAGDPCSYTRKGENVDGTCGSARHGKLICTASNSGASAPSGGAMSAPSGSEGSEGAAGAPSGSMNSGNMAPSGGAAGGNMGSPSAPPSGGTTEAPGNPAPAGP